MSLTWDRMRNVGGWFSSADGAREKLPVRLGRARRETMQAPVRLESFDQVLVWVTVALLAWGLVMVYSATIAMPDNPRFARYSHTYFLVRHSLWLAVSFVAALIAFQVPVATWETLGALAVCRIPAAARGRADSATGQGRQRRTALAGARADQLPALRTGQVRGAAVRRRLHGAQDGCQGALLSRRHADGTGRGHRRGAAAGRAGHGRLHGDRRDCHGHPVPGRRQRAHVFPDRHHPGDRVLDDDPVQRVAARTHLCLPRSLERAIRAGQGLPACRIR